MSVQVSRSLLFIDDQHEWARRPSRGLERFRRHHLIVERRFSARKRRALFSCRLDRVHFRTRRFFSFAFFRLSLGLVVAPANQGSTGAEPSDVGISRAIAEACQCTEPPSVTSWFDASDRRTTTRASTFAGTRLPSRSNSGGRASSSPLFGIGGVPQSRRNPPTPNRRTKMATEMTDP